MNSGRFNQRKSQRGAVRGSRRWALVALAAASTSCVPAGAGMGPGAIGLATATTPFSLELRAPAAAYRPAPRAVAVADDPGAAFRGRTPLDQLRSLDCLAQAIYYEAASESEDGQRAVAQVVLNRVRHPAWPDSVCGVVYQGPMRAGGGCQFTFTCDGSLTARPAGEAWTLARRLAGEALAGRSYTPAGLSTHYHTHAVSPSWAPSLVPTTSIGAHAFYRLRGAGGEPTAFTAAYTGREPLPRPTMSLLRSRPQPSGLAALVAPALPAVGSATASPDTAPQTAAVEAPPSTVRDEYRHSGQWRDDAPTAITGR
ncbi:MAG: cell wall hydrolase [Allosphingosinicella sp.]